MRQKTATRMAFLTAPTIPLLIGAILTPEMQGFDIFTILTFAVIFYFISAIATAALGGPVFFWLLRINLVRWWSGVVAGFIIGATVAIMISLPNFAHSREIFLFGLEGAISAFVFWLIWKQGEIPNGNDTPASEK